MSVSAAGWDLPHSVASFDAGARPHLGSINHMTEDDDEATETEVCPRCGSTVIARMQDDQFRCFNCEFLWDEEIPASGD